MTFYLDIHKRCGRRRPYRAVVHNNEDSRIFEWYGRDLARVEAKARRYIEKELARRRRVSSSEVVVSESFLA